MTAEAIRESDRTLAIIDAHYHFQDFSRNYYAWLCDDRPPPVEGDLTPIRRSYLPPDYAADAAGFTITKQVHVQNGWDMADPVGETRWLRQLSETEGKPDAVVAFADLSDPEVERCLEGHTDWSAVKGVRQILNWHDEPALRTASRPDLMETPDWLRGFRLLQHYNLSFDLQIYWPQMDMALRLARNHPETAIILEHFGMPIDRSPAGIAQWSAAITRLASAMNVTVKLSGFGLGHPHWSIEDTLPLLRRTIDIFGPNRVMMGTNLPVDSLFAKPATIFNAILKTVAGYSEAEATAMLSENAERIYRL
jgi:predicted TIM-barrel fold metal-dependent hydrolase